MQEVKTPEPKKHMGRERSPSPEEENKRSAEFFQKDEWPTCDLPLAATVIPLPNPVATVSSYLSFE